MILLSKACQEEDLSFEDTIWAYENSYKVDLIGEKSSIKSYEEMEKYKMEATEQFKSSDDYVTYKSVLDNCAQLIRDNVTDKETLKKAEIYYE